MQETRGSRRFDSCSAPRKKKVSAKQSALVAAAFSLFRKMPLLLAMLSSSRTCVVEAFLPKLANRPHLAQATSRLAGFNTLHSQCYARFEKPSSVVTTRPFFTSSIRVDLERLLVMAIDDDEQVDTAKTIDSTWNMNGLKKEVARLIFRSHKKIGKASTRLRNAQETMEKLVEDENATYEELEKCPDVDALEMELKELQSRLKGLNELEQAIQGIKRKEAVLDEEIATLALDLGVNDEPPQRNPRGPKKKKGPRLEPKRLPYRRYYTGDKTEIRVGKQAEDNDMLSLSPEHRDGSDWWMHASGCPGSHVVIRCNDQNLDEEVVKDAAALAARQSKCHGATIKVSMTRCRDVSKPPGAKAGLVRLSGRIRTVTVNMKEAEARLDRLDKTVQIN